jgi:hypothetical protein
MKKLLRLLSQLRPRIRPQGLLQLKFKVSTLVLLLADSFHAVHKPQVPPTEEKGVEKNRRSIPALLAGAYTTILLVMVVRVKWGWRAPPPALGWAEFTIMMECRLEGGHCQSVCTLSSVVPPV